MITAGTSSPAISFDHGKDEPDMILQYWVIEIGYIVWRNYKVDGETVKSPVDFDALPLGVYRLIE